MFILVVFGYRQSKIFAIDCLTATLIDSIWFTALKELNASLNQKEDQHGKEKASHSKRITRNEARIQAIDKQLKEDEEKALGAAAEGAQKKDKQPPKPAPKKGAKDAPPSNPLEAERLELSTQIDKSKEALIKYDEKVEKLKIARTKVNEIENNEKLIVELFDKQGERKFVKTKLDTIANSFLSDKNTYVLGYYAPPQQNEEEQVQVLEIEGFCVRTVEEDETAIDEPLIPKKDDKKKGAKKGK